MSVFVCDQCGAESAKWAGRCGTCGAWNSLKQFNNVSPKKKHKGAPSEDIAALSVSDIPNDSYTRQGSGAVEFDNVLGGGIVPGMAVLIGGEPGVGKSTLMLQTAHNLAATGTKVLYVSGEESPGQIKDRATRLNCIDPGLKILCQPDVNAILREIEKQGAALVIIDSIQSVYLPEMDNTPGSVAQLRECVSQFVRQAKRRGTAMFLIGHVTKEGVVAGPKVVEHMVDTVLYFEGETSSRYKLLRAVKNRFGSTNEIGVFEMIESGLAQVANPSALFLYDDVSSPGSAVGAVLKGTRAFLAEVQALAVPTGYGTPQRVAVGIEQKRLAVLLAVLEKRAALVLKGHDVFITLAGGMRAADPGLDLAICAALISVDEDSPIPPKTLLLGEIGLNGEVRPVLAADKRLKEAAKLGYTKAVVSDKGTLPDTGLELMRINQVAKLYQLFKP